MSFPSPKDPFENNSKKDPKKITSTRVAIWTIVGGFGVYLVVNGLVGIITGHSLL
ncbi:MAG: hypothetical protein H7248_09595 [Microbacteriaceae bacterium]|nr:hypothetical protein [Microbacteriaceae bacterium]